MRARQQCAYLRTACLGAQDPSPNKEVKKPDRQLLHEPLQQQHKCSPAATTPLACYHQWFEFGIRTDLESCLSDWIVIDSPRILRLIFWLAQNELVSSSGNGYVLQQSQHVTTIINLGSNCVLGQVHWEVFIKTLEYRMGAEKMIVWHRRPVGICAENVMQSDLH